MVKLSLPMLYTSLHTMPPLYPSRGSSKPTTCTNVQLLCKLVYVPHPAWEASSWDFVQFVQGVHTSISMFRG
jgi:hypothetical protein